MPIVRDPHFCKPPVWPWLFRIDTVWQCPRCKANYRLTKERYYPQKKHWVPLP